VKFDIRIFFENLHKKIQVSLKSESITVLYLKVNIHLGKLDEFSFDPEMFQTKVAEETKKTHFTFNNVFLRIVTFMG
jgi:hypothetical protein